MCSPLFTAAIFTTATIGTQPVSIDGEMDKEAGVSTRWNLTLYNKEGNPAICNHTDEPGARPAA